MHVYKNTVFCVCVEQLLHTTVIKLDVFVQQMKLLVQPLGI